jgi:hypothetical protein
VGQLRQTEVSLSPAGAPRHPTPFRVQMHALRKRHHVYVEWMFWLPSGAVLVAAGNSDHGMRAIGLVSSMEPMICMPTKPARIALESTPPLSAGHLDDSSTSPTAGSTHSAFADMCVSPTGSATSPAWGGSWMDDDEMFGVSRTPQSPCARSIHGCCIYRVRVKVYMVAFLNMKRVRGLGWAARAQDDEDFAQGAGMDFDAEDEMLAMALAPGVRMARCG